jgi:hypothetical protein
VNVSIDKKRWSLFLQGAGTVGYRIAYEVATSSLADFLERVVICDKADIRPCNAITCPEYEQRKGPKSLILAGLMSRWMGRRKVPITPFNDDVGRLPWRELIYEGQVPRGTEPGQIIVAQGLDDWASRLIATQELREAMHDDPNADNVAIIQVGVDKNLASLAMYDCDFSQPCACCQVPGALPQKQACTALNAKGQPARGDLHAEAGAAARFVVKNMIASRLEPSERKRWMLQMIQLFRSHSTDAEFEMLELECELDPDCVGPHELVAPVFWETSNTL